MRRTARTPVLLAVLGTVVSLLATISSGAAHAAGSFATQWPPVNVNTFRYEQMTTSPKGDVTVGCDWVPSSPQDLTTYDASGHEVRRINRTSQLDGQNNCITQPVVDKNGDLYGTPYLSTHLLSYKGNALKWDYPLNCTMRPVIGADGNVYAMNGLRHLIGLTPAAAPGHTEPTKVLDIPIPDGGCGENLQAFKSGIAVSSGSVLHYYSYNGKDLGTPPGHYWGDPSFPINAAGRLFSPTFVSGSFTSAWISAYDPLTKSTAWTTQVSTPGADTMSVDSIRPLPNGGAVAVVRQQKMVSDGIPTTPTEYVFTLVALAPNGQKLWSKALPNTDGAGDLFDYPRTTADTSGKIVLVRTWLKPLSLTNKVPFLTIDVIDGAIGIEKTSQITMSGNTDATKGSVYGYGLNDPSSDSTIGPNTVYISASTCLPNDSLNCVPASDELYPLKVPGVGLDYPRGEILTGPVPVPYVALGDSYSSGEGVEPFESASNQPGYDQCHRSNLAYARLVDGNVTLGASLANGAFAACSGAKTNEISHRNSANNEIAQLTHLNAATRIVTLTLGGNDIGFTDFGTACVVKWSSCAKGSAAYRTAMGKIKTVLPGNLQAAYQSILIHAPNAKIYVLGYPQVAPLKKSTDPEDPRCTYLFNSGYGTVGTPWADAQGARDVVGALDQQIATSIMAVQRLKADYKNRLQYVEVNASTSPFAGHTVCSALGQSYFNNLDTLVHGIAFVFHPNARGQQAYADLLTKAMSGQ